MRKLQRRCDYVVSHLASTRAVLIVVGGFSALLAWTTYEQYTLDELPTRDWCIAALVACAVIGLGAAIVRPTPTMRGRTGIALQLVAALRIWGFGQTTLARTDGFVGFVQGTNAVWVWALIGFLGFLLWARRSHDPTRGDGSDP